MLPAFLADRGFKVESNSYKHQGQTIIALTPGRERVTMRVRLCWRREIGGRDSDRVRTYSAAQLLAKIKDDDWVGSLQGKVKRENDRGVTHLLFVQRDDKDIKYAAMVPLTELVTIWTAQRDASKRLIDEGKLGRRKKNHAMNGTSPTLWLQDDRGGQEVADALWKHPGVLNLAALPRSAEVALPVPQDDGSVTEGRELLRLHRARERNRGLVARKKRLVQSGSGRLACEACEFDFAVAYGSRGDGFAECHHTHPISQSAPGRRTRLSELAVVCANCHRMLHRRPWFTVAELRALVRSQR